MTEEEKLLCRAQGFDFITDYKGKTICLNTKDFNRERFCKDFGFKEVEIFTEENGNKVLYTPTEYEVTNNYLHYKGEHEIPTQPIGCTSYYRMFSNCYKLQSLNLENWDVSNGKDFSHMFGACINLQSFDIENWDVSNGTDFSHMFNWCVELQSLNLENWDVSKGDNFSDMFSDCYNLQSLSLENWDVSKGTNFSNMFNCCGRLQSLNIKNWNTNNEEDFNYMFNGCGKLFERYQVETSDELVKKLLKRKPNKVMSLF